MGRRQRAPPSARRGQYTARHPPAIVQRRHDGSQCKRINRGFEQSIDELPSGGRGERRLKLPSAGAREFGLLHPIAVEGDILAIEPAFFADFLRFRRRIVLGRRTEGLKQPADLRAFGHGAGLGGTGSLGDLGQKAALLAHDLGRKRAASEPPLGTFEHPVPIGDQMAEGPRRFHLLRGRGTGIEHAGEDQGSQQDGRDGKTRFHPNSRHGPLSSHSPPVLRFHRPRPPGPRQAPAARPPRQARRLPAGNTTMFRPGHR